MLTTIKKSQLRMSEEDLRTDVIRYNKEKADHAKTVGTPAPMPIYEITRRLATNFQVVDDIKTTKEPYKPTEREAQLTTLYLRRAMLHQEVLLDLLDYVASLPEADRKFRANRSELLNIKEMIGEDDVV